jgi:hypothetical protein
MLFAGLAGAFLEIDAVIRIDGIFQGHRLAVLDINRLALGQAHVVLIRHFLRAFLGTEPAADTFVHIDIAGLLLQRRRKVSGFAGNGLQLGKGQKLDV